MIEICIKAHQGEGGLKSMCDIVKALEKQNDCFKVFVIDDCNCVFSNDEFKNRNVINKLSKETILASMQARGKIILIKNDGIFAEVPELYIKAKELLETLENNAFRKVYFIYKDIKEI